MEKKIITFGGITNVPDDGLNEAGDMAVLMNMRHKGGELVPCQPPIPVRVDDNISQVLYHANSGYWLALKQGELLVYDNKFNVAESIAERGTIVQRGVESFAIMGNIVIMNFADRVEYAIWRNGTYVYLGPLPEVPRLNMTLEHVVENVETEHYYNYSSEDVEIEKWQEASKGFFDQCLNKHYKNRRFIDNVLFVIGLQLFDGTYKYSHVYYIGDSHTQKLNSVRQGECEISSGKNNFVTIARKRPANYGGAMSAQMNVNILGFNVNFDIQADLEKWKDVVIGIDIFTSGSIMGHTPKLLPINKQDGISTTTGELYYNIVTTKDAEIYTARSIPELREAIESCSSFYRYAKYNISGGLIDVVDDTSPSYLAAQDTLNYTNIKDFVAKSKFVFNQRLHIYGYEDKHVFPSKEMIKSPLEKSSSSGSLDIAVRFNDNSVDKRSYNYATEFPEESKYVSPYITFPERNAKFIQLKTGQTYIESELKEHPFFDYSFCLTGKKKSNYYVECDIYGPMNNIYDENITGKLYVGVDIEVVTNLYSGLYNELVLTRNSINGEGPNISGWVINRNPKNFITDEQASYITKKLISGHSAGTEIRIRFLKKKTFFDISPLEWGNGTTLHSDTKRVIRNNILKVSAVDNPFYFPTAQTYKFEGEIKGLASNAEAISTGQFGQYPLFVFTDTGIWAMSVDASGQGAYTTQSPFSREVCNGAICPVSGGVVFSTDKGVMAISGGQVADLSAALDGFEVDFFEKNAAMWENIFDKAGKDAVVNPVPIRKYIKGAVIAYNYHYNEIIVSNKALFENGAVPYSYVYSLTNKVWSVIDTVFDLTTNKYPELVVFDKGDGAMYTFEDGAALNKVVVITRPFTLGSIDFKRISQAGLRTTFKGALNFYVLGSNDGATFSVITGKEYPSKNGNEPTDVVRRDLITAMSRSKQYKYFAIAVVGDIEGRISMAELLVDMGFANNKIR